MVTTHETVVAIFDEREDAERAIRALDDAGFGAPDIGVAVRDEQDIDAGVADVTGSAGTGAAVGAAAGGAADDGEIRADGTIPSRGVMRPTDGGPPCR